MHRAALVVVLILGSLAACSKDKAASRDTAAVQFGIGQPAPDVTLQLHDGTETKLSAQRGSQVLLFFYPKDDTPG